MYATLATVKVSGFVAKRVGNLSKGVSNYLAKQVISLIHVKYMKFFHHYIMDTRYHVILLSFYPIARTAGG